MSDLTGKRPASPPDPHAETRALAALRQAAWDATQWLTYTEVVEYVEAVMREVERDEP